jgi:WD40 repeat protein
VTGCRDGTTKSWKVSANEDCSIVQLDPVHTFSPFGGVSVTAVELHQQESSMMVIGCEDGRMQLWNLDFASGIPEFVLEVPTQYCHSKTVKRLRWKPSKVSAKVSNEFEWVSCSEDNTVRIHNWKLH